MVLTYLEQLPNAFSVPGILSKLSLTQKKTAINPCEFVCWLHLDLILLFSDNHMAVLAFRR